MKYLSLSVLTLAISSVLWEIDAVVLKEGNDGPRQLQKGNVNDTVVLDSSIHIIRELKNIDIEDGKSVQLKLHWENSYSWKEGNTPLCAACAQADCEKGIIVLKACDKSDKRQKFYKSSDDKIRPTRNKDGCLSYKSSSRVRIRDCRSKRDYYQTMEVREESGDRIQIRGDGDCLSVVNGDPGKGERLKMMSCDSAVRNDVGYWVSGEFDADGDGNDNDDDKKDPDDDDEDEDGNSGGGSGKNFQLKLYWQKGFNWQESRKEKAWCLQCKGSCSDGNSVQMQECNDNDKKQRWVFSSGKFSPYGDKRLCVDYKVKMNLRLRRCNYSGGKSQKFTEEKSSGNRFTYKAQSLCLTQEHHPRSNEKLRIESCSKARTDNTVYWVKGKFNGHP